MVYQIINYFIINLAPIFYQVLYMSVIGSIVGLIIYFIRNIFDHKLSANWKCIMWLIVLFSLLIPARFEFKMDRTILKNEIINKAENIKNIPTHEIHNQEFIGLENLNSNSETDIQQIDYINEKETIIQNITTQELTQKFNINIISLRNLIINVILPLTWLTGFLIILITFIIGLTKINKKNSRIICEDERIINNLEACKKELKINKKIELIIQTEKTTPSIYGLFNPSILLSKDILNNDDNTIRYIFLHELSHYKRKDLLLNYILLLIISLHWFNPFVYFIFKNIRQDIELGADELVLEKLSKQEKKEYGFLLINSLKNIRHEKYASSLLCISDNGKNMERRIQMIKDKEKSKVISAIIVIIILGIIGGFVFVKITNFEETEGIVNLIENSTTTLEKENYEKVWKEPKKFNSYEEYVEFNKSNSINVDAPLTNEEKALIITKEEAKQKAKEILEIYEYKNPYIGNPVLHKNWVEFADIVYVVKVNNAITIYIDAINGNIVGFYDESLFFNEITIDEITEEKAIDIAKDLYKKTGFNENEYKLVSISTGQHYHSSVGRIIWSAKFLRISDEKVLNKYDNVYVSFIVSNDKVHIYVINTRNSLKNNLEDHPIIITQEKAIEIAKQQDRKIEKEEIEYINARLELNQVNGFVWLQEKSNGEEDGHEYHTIMPDGENSNIATAVTYPVYYYEKPIIRKTYLVEIKYKNKLEDKHALGRVYYVDVTTGEIIGGDYLYDFEEYSYNLLPN